MDPRLFQQVTARINQAAGSFLNSIPGVSQFQQLQRLYQQPQVQRQLQPIQRAIAPAVKYITSQPMIQAPGFQNPITRQASKQYSPTIGNYVGTQILKPAATFINPNKPALNRVMGAAQAGFNATPGGTAYNILSGSVGGALRSARTGEPLDKSVRQGIANPTSIASQGLGIKNPILAMGVDMLAGNPKSLAGGVKGIAKGFTTQYNKPVAPQDAKEILQTIERYHMNKGDINYMVGQGGKDLRLLRQYAQDYIAKDFSNTKKFADSKVVQELLNRVRVDQGRPEITLGLVGKNKGFTPSRDWQEVPNGHAVPPGGEYKMNMATGKTEARWATPPIPEQVKQAITSAVKGKERKFVTTVKESAKTPQAIKDIIQGTYIPKSSNQLRNDARALIKRDPVAAENLAINPQGDTHIQVGNELLDHYYATGQLQKANDLAEKMAQSGTEFGRAVQAFANYNKTTPAGALRFAQSKVAEYNRANPQAKLKINDQQVKDLFNKAGKIQKMAEGRERNIASQELMDQVNNLIPSSLADKAVTVWKAGLLTSLRTHERNLIGNTLHGVAEAAKDIPASIADRVMALRTGQRSTGFTLAGTGEGGAKGLQSAKDMITRGYDPEQSINKFDVRHITWGNNPIEQGLKKYTDAVFRTLGAADKPFYNAAFARSLNDQAKIAAMNAGRQADGAFIQGLVQKPTPQMLQMATQEAERATFKNNTKLSQLAQSIQGFKPAGIPVGQVVAPFTGVPSAVAGELIAYSPLGLIKGIASAGKVMAKNIPELQRQAAQEVGRGALGTGLFGIGAYLAGKGLITGQPKDAQEAAQWQLEGKQANSVLIGGKWRSIGSIGPQNLIILAGAKAAEEAGKPDGSVGSYAGNVGKDFLGQTFLQGVQQPLAAINDPARYGQSYVGNQASSVVPNIVKDMAKSGDSYARENNTISDYFTNSLPGPRNQNVVKRDALGNPIPQEPTGAGAFVDLFNSKTPISNPVVNELGRLNNAGFNATPSMLRKDQTINGIKQTLTPQQLDVLESQSGPQASQALNQLFQTPEYQSLSDEEKGRAVDSVVNAVRKQVRGIIDIKNPSAKVPNQQTGQFILVDPATGNVKKIDLRQPLQAPQLTGVDVIDKLSLSKYRGSLTSRANDIYALYQAGKITIDQAAKALTEVSAARSGSGTGGGKAKKIKAVKLPKAKMPKAKKIKLRTIRSKLSTIQLAAPKGAQNAKKLKVKKSGAIV